MAKVFFFFDGFNLYHAFDSVPRYHPYKWISLTALAKCYLRSADRLAGINYFTTLATWDAAKAARHRLFIKAQENEGVEVVYGAFKRKDRKCPACKAVFKSHEEKETDVNIALRLFQLAIRDNYDRAIIVSGDTDLLPAIKAVQATFPGKQIGVLIPIGRASEDLKKQADFHHKMKEAHLQAARYPDSLTLSDGAILHCPPAWKSESMPTATP